jgi:hypothetical protein
MFQLCRDLDDDFVGLPTFQSQKVRYKNQPKKTVKVILRVSHAECVCVLAALHYFIYYKHFGLLFCHNYHMTFGT